MRLYAITGRKTLPAGATLRELYRNWTEAGVDFIQLREKDLDASALKAVAEGMTDGIDRRRSMLLVNGQAALALTLGADGVHVPGPPSPAEAERARKLFQAGGRECVVSMACHSLDEVEIARRAGADMALYSPIFAKKPASGNDAVLPVGIAALRQACQAAGRMPVFALGGVTASNAGECISAGAAGVAGISLFAGESWRELLG